MITFEGHEGAVSAGVLTADGQTIVTGSRDATVRVWDVASRTQRREFRQHTGPAYSVAVSRNGTTAVSGAQDNTVRVWSLPPNAPFRTFSGPESPAQFSTSPDGSTTLAIHSDGKLRLWHPAVADQSTSLVSATTSRTVTTTDHSVFGMPDAAILNLSSATRIQFAAWRNDGVLFVTSDDGGHLMLWSPELPAPVGIISDVPDGVTHLLLTANNQQAVTVHADGVVRVWQLGGWPSIADAIAILEKNKADAVVAGTEPAAARNAYLQREIRISDASIRDASLIAGGNQLLVCSTDGLVSVTDINNGNRIRDFRCDNQQPLTACGRPDSQRIAIGTDRGEVFVWNAGNNEQPLQRLAVSQPVTAMCFSANNQLLAVAARDQTIHLFGRSLPGMTPAVELVPHQQIVAESTATQLAFTDTDRTVLANSSTGRINAWRYSQPEQIRQFNHGGAVYGVAISEDARTIVSCSADQTIRIWDNSAGSQRFQLNGHVGPVHAVAFSPDQTLVVSAGADGTLRLWDVVGGRQLKQLIRFQETMYSLSFHPSGKIIAAAGADRKIHMIDVATGDEIRTMEGHRDYIHCVAFTPDGNHLLSYGYAGSLRLWDADNGQLVLNRMAGRIGNYAQFSSDGQQILLSNGDGMARLVQSEIP